LPKPETIAPKPENESPIPSRTPLHDAGIRAVMVPVFGVAIPYLTGYFGHYTPRDGKYWIGLAWAILISFTIWQGNRYLLLRQREHYDWFQHPFRKIAVLLFAAVFYTTPCAVLMIRAWYAFAGMPPDWNGIRTAALACVICVAFITHVYETVYLIRQREGDMLAVERLERARVQAELEALKAQVTPHFLFNSLNTLSWLIENNPSRARAFNQNLAEVYRYILMARRREMVPLSEEWEFLEQYCGLLSLRFEDSLALEFENPGERGGRWLVPPLALQSLVENAVKHNEHSRQHPLHVRIGFGENAVTVANKTRHKPRAADSAGLGLRMLDERCRLALGKGIDVLENDGWFRVSIPAQTT
jgi:Histidine kinase